MTTTTNNTVTQIESKNYWTGREAGEYTYTTNDFANRHTGVDTYPYEIVEIKTEKTIVIRSMSFDRLTKTFNKEETGELVTLKKAKDGCWYTKGGMKKGKYYELANQPSFYQSREF